MMGWDQVFLDRKREQQRFKIKNYSLTFGFDSKFERFFSPLYSAVLVRVGTMLFLLRNRKLKRKKKRLYQSPNKNDTDWSGKK
jgi:hypothetical protein